jgi:hypothetical protein
MEEGEKLLVQFLTIQNSLPIASSILITSSIKAKCREPSSIRLIESTTTCAVQAIQSLAFMIMKNQDKSYSMLEERISNSNQRSLTARREI